MKRSWCCARSISQRPDQDKVRTRPIDVGQNVRANLKADLRYKAADMARAMTLQTTMYRKRGRSVTLLGAGGLVPDVVGDGRGRHGKARFAGGGRSYD
jgi:hypothetical protein